MIIEVKLNAHSFIFEEVYKGDRLSQEMKLVYMERKKIVVTMHYRFYKKHNGEKKLFPVYLINCINKLILTLKTYTEVFFFSSGAS